MGAILVHVHVATKHAIFIYQHASWLRSAAPSPPPLPLLHASSAAAAASAAPASCAEILNRTKLGDLLLPLFFLLSLSLFLLRAHLCCTFRFGFASCHAHALAASCHCPRSAPAQAPRRVSVFLQGACLDFCCIVLLLATDNLICRLIIYVSLLFPSTFLCAPPCLYPFPSPCLSAHPFPFLFFAFLLYSFFIIVFSSSRSPFVLAAT